MAATTPARSSRWSRRRWPAHTASRSTRSGRARTARRWFRCAAPGGGTEYVSSEVSIDEATLDADRAADRRQVLPGDRRRGAARDLWRDRPPGEGRERGRAPAALRRDPCADRRARPGPPAARGRPGRPPVCAPFPETVRSCALPPGLPSTCWRWCPGWSRCSPTPSAGGARRWRRSSRASWRRGCCRPTGERRAWPRALVPGRRRGVPRASR